MNSHNQSNSHSRLEEELSLKESSDGEFNFNAFEDSIKEGLNTEDTNFLKTKLIVIILLTLLIAVGQIISGIYAHSLAILSDALHKFIDITGLILIYIGFKIIEKKPTRKFTFGFSRIEGIVSLINIVSIWALGIWLLWESIDKLTHKHYDVNAKVRIPLLNQIMLMISGFSLVLDIFMTFMLHSYDIQKIISSMEFNKGLKDEFTSDNHNNNCELHGHTHENNQEHSMNYRAIVLHIIADILHSFGILIASLFIYFNSELMYLDSLLTLVFSFLILISTRKLLSQVYDILMEASPPSINVEIIAKAFQKVPEVIAVKDIHVWSLSTRINLLIAKVVAKENDIALTKCKDILKSFNILYSTIEVTKA